MYTEEKPSNVVTFYTLQRFIFLIIFILHLKQLLFSLGGEGMHVIQSLVGCGSL